MGKCLQTAEKGVKERLTNPLIRLTSVTYAIRGQKVLERHGIRSYIRKQTGNLKTYGCGYGLEIHGDATAAAQLIRNAGIRVIGIE